VVLKKELGSGELEMKIVGKSVGGNIQAIGSVRYCAENGKSPKSRGYLTKLILI